MKLNHWLWVGGLVVLVCSAVRLSRPPSTPAPTVSSQTHQGRTQPTSTSGCQSARPAVVTLYASTEFGAGSIISPEGLVLTSYHVVKAASDGQIRARGWTGSLFKGQVIAIDRGHDLALVQLDAKQPLPAIHFGDVLAMQAGQAVCAIGSPLGHMGVLTLGTLKGTHKKGDLQASILLHPGNSGGPLLNQQGEMIGVNKAIWLSATGENIGIGFATTIAIAQTFIKQNRSKVTAIAPRSTAFDQNTRPQAFVDFGLDTSTQFSAAVDSLPKLPTDMRLGALIDEQSLVIQLVEPNSPAEKAGLSAGDRLLAIDRQPLSRLEDLQTFLKRHPRSAVVTIRRQQAQQEMRLNF